MGQDLDGQWSEFVPEDLSHTSGDEDPFGYGPFEHDNFARAAAVPLRAPVLEPRIAANDVANTVVDDRIEPVGRLQDIWSGDLLIHFDAEEPVLARLSNLVKNVGTFQDRRQHGITTKTFVRAFVECVVKVKVTRLSSVGRRLTDLERFLEVNEKAIGQALQTDIVRHDTLRLLGCMMTGNVASFKPSAQYVIPCKMTAAQKRLSHS
jgi:hypothetical protein